MAAPSPTRPCFARGQRASSTYHLDRVGVLAGGPAAGRAGQISAGGVVTADRTGVHESCVEIEAARLAENDAVGFVTWPGRSTCWTANIRRNPGNPEAKVLGSGPDLTLVPEE